MLKPEENERLVRVGPGTALGEAFRRYWLPALLSSELAERDGPPQRLRLLGEDLVAFRDSDGQVGILDASCPHRRAPMFFGRNEECGLRCVYHGWKFDRTGACVEMPSEPADSLFREKVRIVAYPAWDDGTVVWLYLGPPETMPPPPDYEWVRAPRAYKFVSKTFEACNYLQALEGGFDTAHSSFLHNERLGDRSWIRNRDTAPRLDVERTPYGFSAVSVRDLGDEGLWVRVYQFVMPAQQMRPGITGYTGRRAAFPQIDGHVWVPIDDEHTWVWNWACSYDRSLPFTPERGAEWEAFLGRGKEDVMPGFRLKANASNDFLIDRALQKTSSFTGIKGLNTQDVAVQEGMGPIVDRSREHLGTTDRAIIACRQLLLEAAAAVEAGETPRGTDPATYRRVRPYDDFVAHDVAWQTAFADELVAKF